MISVKNSYEIAYNGTENECRFELYADTTADLQGLTHIDGIKIQMGSECTDIATGDKYLLNGSGVWVLQPSANAWQNVYTKAEIDSMITEIYDVIAYYHTTLISDTGEITFYSLGGNVGTLAIYGNGQQTGTPTPDNPVMPTFCGVRTGNLVQLYQYSSKQTNHYYADYYTAIGSSRMSDLISAINTATDADDVCLTFETDNDAFAPNVVVTYEGGTQEDKRNPPFVIKKDKKVSELIVRARSGSSAYDGTVVTVSNFMLNLGSTALPYEPFGWTEKITCAGQTVPVYLGQTHTVRKIRKLVLTGNEDFAKYSQRNEDWLYYCALGSANRAKVTTAICTHVPYQSYTSQDSNPYVRISDTKSSLLLNFGTAIGSNNVTAFKAYLAAQYANGTPVTIWYVLATEQTGIVNEPLAKIGDYADELHITDADVSIPTVSGENTLTVDTTLPPSKIVISGE